MRMPVRPTVSALILVAGLTAVLAGCARTTTGTVAQTTEPGPPIATTTAPPTPTLLPGLPIPELPLPTRDTDVPTVPAPANAQSMTCDEYGDLDEPTQWAVIRAILADRNNPLGPYGGQGESIAKTLADTVCQFLPNSTVSEVLLTG